MADCVYSGPRTAAGGLGLWRLMVSSADTVYFEQELSYLLYSSVPFSYLVV